MAEAVEIVDTGLTAGEHQYCAMGSDPDPSDGCERGTLTTSHKVTYGVVVHNNSDRLLRGILVTIDVVDAQGQPMTLGYGRERVIPRLLPGEELGLGDVTTLDRAGATRLEVAVQPAASWSSVEFAQARGDRALLLRADMREADKSGYGAIGPGGDPMDWTISYFGDISLPEGTAGRPSAGTTFATATVVLRDESRRIVGGATAPAAGIPGASVQGEIEVDVTHLPLPFVEVTVDDVYVSDFRIG